MARCFVGIMLPEALRESTEPVKDGLRKLPIRCKFVERENLHICLSFLGEVEEERLKSISEGLKSICKNYQKLEITINGMKMIPTESYVRVLALEVIDKNGRLDTIRRDIQKKIGGDSKPPHVTLCRVKKIEEKSSTIQKIKSIKSGEVSFTVSAVQIIKSELSKTGPIYTPIFEAQLK